MITWMGVLCGSEFGVSGPCKSGCKRKICEADNGMIWCQAIHYQAKDRVSCRLTDGDDQETDH